jgi:hypothetical protein
MYCLLRPRHAHDREREAKQQICTAKEPATALPSHCHREYMSVETPLLLGALQLLDVGGNAAVCVGVDRLRARMLKWHSLKSTHPEDIQASPVISLFTDKARSESLGMFAPFPDQVILNILERLQSTDLHR